MSDCSDFCHDFLGIIEQDLLVVDPQQRGNCRDLVKKLRKIWERCQANGESYCVVGRPRPITEPLSPLLENKPTRFDYREEAKERMKQSQRPVSPFDQPALRHIVRSRFLSQDSERQPEGQQVKGSQPHDPHPNIAGILPALPLPKTSAPDPVASSSGARAATPRLSSDGGSIMAATEDTPLLPPNRRHSEPGHSNGAEGSGMNGSSASPGASSRRTQEPSWFAKHLRECLEHLCCCLPTEKETSEQT